MAPLYHNILTLFSVILVLLWNAHLHILLESNSTCLLRPILQVASSGKLFFFDLSARNDLFPLLIHIEFCFYLYYLQ